MLRLTSDAQPDNAQIQSLMGNGDAMNNYIIFRRNGWSSKEELEAAAARSGEVAAEMAADVSWIRTYILAEENGSLGTVCVYQATSEDKVREHADCAGIPADQIILIGDLIVVNPDPES
jgi:sporulation protein YlmC with PRC-barrel domain